VSTPQEGCCEKDVKSKVAPRNSYDSALKAEILTVQANLVLNPSETWRRRQKFT